MHRRRRGRTEPGSAPGLVSEAQREQGSGPDGPAAPRRGDGPAQGHGHQALP